ncbi:unnamed protein product [Leptidea sinapis]|uniref:Uncharacterized protein n=1 Tax=Leptidea sinapis TaxID=189913 RepID=A0A5E4PW09_9NEOP|nr:unnamed protein product [Leptidea sinapis]
MIQKPFSEGVSILKNNSILSQNSMKEILMFPDLTAAKTMYHNKLRPKISTIYSSLETGRSKTAYAPMRRQDYLRDNRLARDALPNITLDEIAANKQNPPWVSKTAYWNQAYEDRYESLMRNPNWPPLHFGKL